MAISHVAATYDTVLLYYQFLWDVLIAMVMTYPFTVCHLIVGTYM